MIEDLKRALVTCQRLGFDYLPVSLKPLNFRKNQPSNLYPLPQNDSPNLTPAAEMTVEMALEDLKDTLTDCARCALHEQRAHIVFGEGSEKTGLMLIGEAPDADDDLQARPFVGPTGKLLDNLIHKLGLKREELYIATLVKCRPPMDRKPEPLEIETCKPFLLEQIRILKPRVIITFGAFVSQQLLQSGASISALRGKVFEFEGVQVVPTYHPAYLLKRREAKNDTWSDAQKALKLLNESPRLAF